MIFRALSVLAAALAFTLPAWGQETRLNGLTIAKAYARATVANQPAGAAYLTIENKGKTADKLTGASSPVAGRVEIHSMTMDGNLMRMREVGQVEIEPSGKLEMKPGDGYHLMLMRLRQPLKAGDTFPVTLTFEKAGKAEVKVSVRDKGVEGGTHRAH